MVTFLFFFINFQVSFVKMEGDKITQQIAQDSTAAYATPLPPAKKIVAGKKKMSPARFIVPLQGVIANDGDRVVLECTIDGRKLLRHSSFMNSVYLCSHNFILRIVQQNFRFVSFSLW